MITYNNAPEQDIDIDLPDGKKIHGIVRGSLTDGSPVAIIMHGQPGTGNELLEYLGARYLYEHGISSLRLFMYDFGAKYRDLLDCTLETHIADFDTVVKYLREQGVKKVFAAGHSYGGITIVGSKAKLDAAVLWDASHGLAFQDDDGAWKKDFPELSFGEMVVCPTGYGYISSKQAEAYDKALGDNSEWAAGKGYPMKFITASEGILAGPAKKYFAAADEPKAFVEIAGAHHQFEDSDEIVEQLFRETVDWFEKYA